MEKKNFFFLHRFLTLSTFEAPNNCKINGRSKKARQESFHILGKCEKSRVLNSATFGGTGGFYFENPQSLYFPASAERSRMQGKIDDSAKFNSTIVAAVV